MSSYRALAILLIAAILLGARASTARLGEDGALGQRSVLITIEQPNAAQDAIERDIVIPLEDQLAGVRGAAETEALIRHGRAHVQVRFAPNTKMAGAYLEVRDSVERASAAFPPTAQRPVISRSDIDARPLFAAAFDAAIWNEADILALYEQIEGVARVEISGARAGDIEVVYDPSALPDELSGAAALVGAVHDRQVAAGTSESGVPGTSGPNEELGTLPLILDTRAGSPQEIGRTWITDTLRLGHVAGVGAAAGTSSGVARVDGRARAIAYIYNSPDANAVEVSRRLRRATLPHAATVVLLDRGAELERRLRDAARSVAAGLLSICLLTYLADRSLRLTFVAAGSLGISALAGSAALAAFGLEVTVRTLAALAISAGIGIDSVVVLFDALRRSHGDVVRARGHAAAPVLLSAITTVVVFVPLLFAPAPETERYGGVALAITASLAAAVMYVLFLAPHLAGAAQRDTHVVYVGTAGSKALVVLQRVVVLSYRRRRLILMGAVLIPLLAAAVWVLMPRSGGDPHGSRNEIRFSLVFKPGTVASAVAERSHALELSAVTANDVERVIADYRDERARFLLRLRAGADADAVRSAVEEAARSVDHGELFFTADLDQRSFRSVAIVIRGPQLETAQDIATIVAGAYQRLVAVERVVFHFREGPPAHLLQLDLPRLERLGVDPAAVIAELRWTAGNQVVAKRPAQDREHDIVLLPRSDPAVTIESLLSLPMFGSERNISALDLGHLRPVATRSSISRVNRARSARLSVVTSHRDRVRRELHAVTRALPIPDGYTVDIAPDALQESMTRRSQVGAVLMAPLLIGAVLVCYSQRAAESFVMLAQIPAVLAVPVLALWALGIPMNATVIMGLILSAGVSVNNSILVLDEHNRVTGDGVTLEDSMAPAVLTAAILTAARPLTLAAITTLAGVAPLLLGAGDQTAVAILSLSLALGVLGSVVTTFTLLPALYLLVVRPSASRTSCRRSRSTPSAEASASCR